VQHFPVTSFTVAQSNSSVLPSLLSASPFCVTTIYSGTHYNFFQSGEKDQVQLELDAREGRRLCHQFSMRQRDRLEYWTGGFRYRILRNGISIVIDHVCLFGLLTFSLNSNDATTALRCFLCESLVFFSMPVEDVCDFG
jgi:hypothetical protein